MNIKVSLLSLSCTLFLSACNSEKRVLIEIEVRNDSSVKYQNVVLMIGPNRALIGFLDPGIKHIRLNDNVLVERDWQLISAPEGGVLSTNPLGFRLERREYGKNLKALIRLQTDNLPTVELTEGK